MTKPEPRKKHMYDWYIRTDDIVDPLATFCRLLEIEQVDHGQGWTIIRCTNPDQRRALQISHERSTSAALDYLSRT
jgi:hypothetical protein